MVAPHTRAFRARSVPISALALAVLSIGSLVLTLRLMGGGGFAFELMGVDVRAFDFTRPLFIGVLSTMFLILTARTHRGLAVTGWSLLAMYGALALIAMARQAAPKVPEGDMALIESYTMWAEQGELFVGPYSRFAWNHPGPMYFYLLAPFHALADWRSPSLWAGALAINLTSLFIIFWTAYRYGSTLLAIALSVTCGVYVWRVSEIITSPWNPHVLVLPTMAVIVLCAAMAAGSIALLPLVALTASFAAQTHVGLVPTVVALAAAATVTVVARKVLEREPSARSTVYRSVNAAAWVLLIVWLPPLAEEIHVYEGNLTRLWEFFVEEERTGQLFSDAFPAWADHLTGVVGQWLHVGWGGPYRRTPTLPPQILAVLELALLAIVAVWSSRRGDRFLSALATLTLAASLLACWSVTRIENELMDHAIFWITGIGVVNIAVLAGAAARAFPWGQWLPSRRVVVAICGAAWLACAFIGVQHLQARVARASDPSPDERRAAYFAETIVTYFRAHPDLKPLIRIDQEAWHLAAGALVQVHKVGIPFGVEKGWAFMFSESAAARGDENAVVVFARQPRYEEIMAQPGRALLAERAGTYIVLDTTGELLR